MKRYLTCCFAALLLAPAGDGAITGGDSSVTLNYEYLAGNSTAIVGGEGANNGISEAVLTLAEELVAETDVADFEGSIGVSLIGETQFNPEPGGERASLTGYQRSQVALSGSGVFFPVGDIRGGGNFTSVAEGNQVISGFTISDTDVAGELTLSMSRLNEEHSLISFKIERLHEETWSPFKSFFIEGRASLFRQDIEFTPGTYRVRTSMPVQEAYSVPNGPPEIDVSQYLGFSLQLGEPPVPDPELPPSGQYYAPGVSVFKTDPEGFIYHNPQIVAEIPQGDGTTLVEFMVELSHSNPQAYTNVDVLVREGQPGTASAVNNPGTATFDEVPPGGVVMQSTIGRVTVSDAELAALRAGILDTSLLTIEGEEMLIFRYPVQVLPASLFNLDEQALAFWKANPLSSVPPHPIYQVENSVDPDFITHNVEDPDPAPPPPAGPTIQDVTDAISGAGVEPGKLLIEWPAIFDLQPRRIQLPALPEPVWVQNFDSQLPFFVNVSSSGGPPLPGVNRWLRFGGNLGDGTLPYSEVLIHGRVTQSVTPPYQGPTSRATEDNQIDTQTFLPKVLPIHFNRLPLGDIATLSGNVTLVPGTFDVALEMEDGSPSEYFVTSRYTAEVNLLLETKNNETVRGSPLIDESTTLFEAPLFVAALPGGITLSPTISLTAGANANVTRSLSIPFTAKYEMEVTTGVRDGVPFYEDNSRVIPLKVSNPSVFDEIGASAEIWLDAELFARVSYGGALGIGPTVSARLTSDFSLNPLGDPWWSMGADLTISAGMEVDVAPSVEIIDAERVIAGFPLFEIDSGGPLLPPSSSKSLNVDPDPGIRPLGPGTDRWMRSVQTSQLASTGNALLCRLSNGDFLSGHGNQFGNQLYRFAPDGVLLNSSTGAFHRIVDASPAADDGAFILGVNPGRLQITRLDPQLLSSGTLDFTMPPLYSSQKILSTTDRHYILGNLLKSGPTRNVAVVTCLTHPGTILWSRQYELPANASFAPADFALSADGSLLVCGVTSADFTEAEGLTSQLVNVTNNAFVTRLDGTNGDPLWTRVYASRSNVAIHAIAESPTGEITLGGHSGVTVLDDRPGLLVSQIDSQGGHIETLLIGHSGSEKSSPNPDAAHLITTLPHGGETYHDEIRDLVWTDEGLWACGKIGIYNGGLPTFANGSIAFSLFLDPQLTPGRFAIHGGNSQDEFHRILVTEDGPLVAGMSRSFHPWPAGATDETANTPAAHWLVKLPWEGRVDFHPLTRAFGETTAAEPRGGSFFVYPRVVSGNLSGLFDLNDVETDSYGETVTAGIRDVARTLTITDLTPAAGSAQPSFVAASVVELKALEYMPSELVVDEPTFYAWNQIGAGDDHDGDGIDACSEFFFGTDPFVQDDVRISLLSADPPVLEVPRNPLAAPSLPQVFQSENLTDWFPVVPIDSTVEPWTRGRERLLLTLPNPDPRPEKLFFDVEKP